MVNFQKVKLGDVVTKIIGGGTPSKSNSNYWNGSLPWASVKDLCDNKYYLDSTQDSITEDGLKNSASNLIKKDTVILPTRMGLGRVVKTRIDTTINQDLKAIIPNEKINNDFLLWSLVNSGQTLRSLGNGSTVSGIRLEELKNIVIDLPDLVTQIRIASVLSSYDDLIENNEKLIKVLEEMAQLLYTEWFVKFKFPGYEKFKMVESGTEYGKVPEGWEVKKLDQISEINSENITSNNGPEIIRYVDIASVSTGKIDAVQAIIFAKAPSRARRMVRHGDIIWSTVRPNKKSYALIIKPVENLVVSTGFAVIRASKIPYTYLYHVLTSDNFVAYLVNHAQGVAYPAVTSDDFAKAVILVSATQLLKDFDILCEPIAHEIDKLLKQNDNLSKTRDLLIPQLVTGKHELK